MRISRRRRLPGHQREAIDPDVLARELTTTTRIFAAGRSPDRVGCHRRVAKHDSRVLHHEGSEAYGTISTVTHPVYLVRHGQSEWNALRLTQGQTSHPPLTSLGREQAERAASLIGKDLAGRPVTRILTSDLVRAVETAEVAGKALRAPVASDTRLREQHLGELEGRGYDETWAAAVAHDWSDPTLPLAGRESIMDVHDRMGAVLAEGAELDGAVAALVSHGDAIRAAIAHLTGVAPHEAPWAEIANGAVARVNGRSHGWARRFRRPYGVPVEERHAGHSVAGRQPASTGPHGASSR